MIRGGTKARQVAAFVIGREQGEGGHQTQEYLGEYTSPLP